MSTVLIHETSLAAAQEILRSGRISGASLGLNSHESFPHFYFEGQQRGRNKLGSDKREIGLIFEVKMPVIQVHRPFVCERFPTDAIIRMSGIGDELWQAIIRPGSGPLRLVGCENLGASCLDEKMFGRMKRWCCLGWRIRPCYFEDRCPSGFVACVRRFMHGLALGSHTSE